jgi:hypothetical protein
VEPWGDPSVDELFALFEHKSFKVEEVYAKDIRYYPVKVETIGEEGIDDPGD